MTTVFLSCPKCGEQLSVQHTYFCKGPKPQIKELNCPGCGWKQDNLDYRKKQTETEQPDLFGQAESYQPQRDESCWWCWPAEKAGQQ